MKETKYAQPAIASCTIAAFEIFQKAGFAFDFAAGHSLGELSALYAAGIIKDKTTFAELVCKRAREMSATNSAKQGTMAAVVGAGACNIRFGDTGDLWVANVNSPKQVVISGAKKAYSLNLLCSKRKGLGSFL